MLPVGIGINWSSQMILPSESNFKLKVTETDIGKELKTFRGHTEWVSSLTHKPNSIERFFSGAWDGKIRVWTTDIDNPIKGKTEHLFTSGNDNAVYSLEYSDT